MKRILLIAVVSVLAFSFTSCKEKELREEIAVLTQENQQLREKGFEKDSTITEFFASMNQIKENLDMIKAKQNIISEGTTDKAELKSDVRASIENDLELINRLMEDNRRRINTLNRNLRESNTRLAEFESIIALLNDNVQEKDLEIINLRDNLAKLNVSVEVLTANVDRLENENREKAQVIDQKIEQLNTAYYVMGTRKELEEKNVIDRRGGLLGMGRTTVVTSDVPRDHFTRVDLTQLKEVKIHGKNPVIISTHPQDSYKIEPMDDQTANLKINNADKFWTSTRYLVVRVDK